MLLGINLLARTIRAKQIKFIGANTKKNKLETSPEKRGIENTVICKVNIGIIAKKGKKNAEIG
jgi:hypothetical protein